MCAYVRKKFAYILLDSGGFWLYSTFNKNKTDHETDEAEIKPDMMTQRACGGGMQVQNSPELMIQQMIVHHLNGPLREHRKKEIPERTEVIVRKVIFKYGATQGLRQ